MSLVPSGARAQVINYGQNFLTGKVSSLFASSDIFVQGATVKEMADNCQNYLLDKAAAAKKELITDITTIGNSIGNAAGNIIGAASQLSGSIMQSAELAHLAIGEMKTYCASVITDTGQQLLGMAARYPGYFQERMGYWTKTLASDMLKEKLKQVIIPAEKENKKKEEKKKNDNIKIAIYYVKEAVNTAKTYINMFNTYLNEDSQEVANMMLMGPQWVSNQIDTQVDMAKYKIGYWRDTMMSDIQSKVNKAADKAAYSSAQTAINDFIEPQVDKLITKFNDINKSTSATKQKAMTKIQKALMKLAGKLGVPMAG